MKLPIDYDSSTLRSSRYRRKLLRHMTLGALMQLQSLSGFFRPISLDKLTCAFAREYLDLACSMLVSSSRLYPQSFPSDAEEDRRMADVDFTVDWPSQLN